MHRKKGGGPPYIINLIAWKRETLSFTLILHLVSNGAGVPKHGEGAAVGDGLCLPVAQSHTLRNTERIPQHLLLHQLCNSLALFLVIKPNSIDGHCKKHRASE